MTGWVLWFVIVVMIAIPRLLFRHVARPLWRAWSRIWDCQSPAAARSALLMRVRDLLAIVALLAAHGIWRWGSISVTDEINAGVSDRLRTFGLLLMVVCIVATVFIAMARRGHRLETAALMLIPLWIIITLALVVILALVLFLPQGPGAALVGWLDGTLIWTEGGSSSLNILYALWQAVKVIGGVLIVVSLATTAVAALVMCVRSMFRARDAHPLMEPVVAIALAIIVLAFGVTEWTSVDPAFPWWVAIILTFVGPLVVIALSALQIAELREAGHRFRSPTARACDDVISARALQLFEGVAGLGSRAFPQRRSAG
ncbi:hypothetical protein [uncultured Microbacterium sp.]|uniref:hypothetical protein n=1 Tax=uncultured Microbacterium sp. TaxID=191216 RepID=UPI00260C3CB9|nr:hypothetical protein [uncultured Microbacterium sp.]